MPERSLCVVGLRRGLHEGFGYANESSMEPPLEFATCRLCRRLIALCSGCRTRATCSPECRREHRRRQVREAGRRYQASAEGAAAHAERQRRYRAQQRETVTHQTRQDSSPVIAPAPAPNGDSVSSVGPVKSAVNSACSLNRCTVCRQVTSSWHRPFVIPRRPRTRAQEPRRRTSRLVALGHTGSGKCPGS